MLRTGVNIIRKSILEFQICGGAEALVVQKELDDLCRTDLMPQLAAMLEAYSQTEKVFRIENLTVDVSGISALNFKDLTQPILKELDRVLKEAINESEDRNKASGFNLRDDVPNTNQASPRRELELLIFYLENGFLPWWSAAKTASDWRSLINDLPSSALSTAEISGFQRALGSKAARERLVLWLPDDFFWSFLKRFTSYPVSHLTAALSALDKTFRPLITVRDLRDAFKFSLVEFCFRKGTNEFDPHGFSSLLAGALTTNYQPKTDEIKTAGLIAEIIEVLVRESLAGAKSTWEKWAAQAKAILKDEYLSQNVFSRKPGEEDSSAPEYKLPEWEDCIYITNAGLVIAAPYLSMFFKEIGLLSGGQIKDVPKAIAILHFIAAGDDEYEEFQTVLPKILCGCRLDEVLQKAILSEEDKAKADDLLMSLIENWSILQNTSVEALRLSFLQREGRLSFVNNEWQLAVQHEAFDMLIEHIPWNIHLIKLPWMQHLLKVDWA